MEQASTQTRPQSRRDPLRDGSQQANTSHRSPSALKIKTMRSSSDASGLPHHESLNPNGPMTVLGVTSSHSNKRLSAVTSEDSESKRNSQVSTTSSRKGRRRKTHIGPWELGSDIGKGGIGRVRKVRHCVTGQQAAVKIIPKKVAETARAESLMNLVESSKRPSFAAFGHVMPFGIEREVIIMKLLEHPNVVKLYDVWENQSELYLVMEYVNGGELFDFIRDKEYLDEDESVWLFRQMLAALLHCHRLGIHHRDLKPENILLDKDSKKVKLADFGMAALQPKGRHLTTPCGSLHYAAPEVFERNYDGSKIDVWSLGIILFVMLTGTTPFYYDPELYEGRPKDWFKVLKRGQFEMPPELSADAQDLLRNMLQPSPQKRISLEGAWRHPFLHKYEDFWGETAESGRMENWIGATPLIREWHVKSRSDIDRELLRNLRTLWHSEIESVLIDRLVSDQPNHEKYFYYALLKHRDEQLENYDTTPDTLGYSTSDYHHIGRSKTKSTTTPRPGTTLSSRTKSTFSILNDEHLQSRSSLLEAPASERSYDPYRASRSHLTSSHDQPASVTVHRGPSKHSRSPSGGQSLRHHPPSLRIEALKKEQRRTSKISSSASLRPASISARSRASLSRASMSRASLASSVPQSSSPIIVRPSAKHKRGVNFSHLRKSSTASALDDARGTNSHTTTPHNRHGRDNGAMADIRDPLSSPALYAATAVKSRKETARQPTRRSSTLRDDTRSQVIDKEARKVSTEYAKFCDEVLNRSSASSSQRTSDTISQAAYETPPSSVSNGRSSHSAKEPMTPNGSKRPLPEAPVETPVSYATREIAETRDRLAARYAAEPGANSQTYSEVLAHLDAMLRPTASHVDAKRVLSLPEPKHSGFFSDLPAISEEGRIPESDLNRVSRSTQGSRLGAAERSATSAGASNKDTSATVRLVEPSSPHRPAPLNIRKVSSATTTTALRTPHVDTVQLRQYLEDGSGPYLRRVSTPTSPKRLNMFDDHDQSVAAGADASTQVPTKKRAWWRRNWTPEIASPKFDSSTRWDSLQTRNKLSTSADHGSRPKRDSDSSTKDPMMSGALPVQHSPTLPGKRPGFLKFLKRTPKSYVDEDYVSRREHVFALTPSVAALSSNANDEGEPTSPSTKTGPSLSQRSNVTSRPNRKEHAIEDTERADLRDVGMQRNWLARFLHIKPTTRAICFQTTRGRALSQIARLLDNWRVHGVHDVAVDRTHNLIFGRLDTVNALGLKAVEFVVEIFIVLQEGRRKGLSIARWTQRKGAASSFKRVVQEVETRLDSKGLLVKDKHTRREMEMLLAEVAAV